MPKAEGSGLSEGSQDAHTASVVVAGAVTWGLAVSHDMGQRDQGQSPGLGMGRLTCGRGNVLLRRTCAWGSLSWLLHRVGWVCCSVPREPSPVPGLASRIPGSGHGWCILQRCGPPRPG